MKKQNERSRRWIKDKRFYTYTAFALTAAILAIVVIVTAAVIAKDNSVSVNNSVNNSSPSDSTGGSSGDSSSGGNEQTGGVKFEDFLLPVEYVSVSGQFGFYYNQTLNSYYEHKGVDFIAEAGDEVYAAQSGIVESVYTADLLSGTEITVDHGNGVKSVYRFVEALEGLEVGQEVKRGDVIACIAEATGDEYKEGAHLHFEVLFNNQPIDPATYLTLAEK